MYQLINKSRIKTGLLRDIIEFCRPADLDNFFISFYPLKDDKLSYDGHTIRIDNRTKVIIKIGGAEFPMFNHSKDFAKLGYIGRKLIRDEIELLIYLISHELRHAWQMSVSKRDFFSGKYRSFSAYKDGDVYEAHYGSEKDASLYGCRMLNKYRSLNN